MNLNTENMNYIQLDTENMNYSPERFLKWMTKHPDRYNAYLNRRLKDIKIVIKDKDIYLYGDDYREIYLNNCPYSNLKDIITLPELLEAGIIKDPIFIIQNDFYDDLYGIDQYIVGVTDNYEDAVTIAKQYPEADVYITKRNQPVEIPAGAYIE